MECVIIIDNKTGTVFALQMAVIARNRFQLINMHTKNIKRQKKLKCCNEFCYKCLALR